MHIYGLGAIRFICALWVVFGHLGPPPLLGGIDTTNRVGWAIHGGWLALFSAPAAVIIFFVISGFCIHYPNRHGTRGNWSIYYVRRYLRIGIPMAIAKGIYLCLDLPTGISGGEEGIFWSLHAEIIYYTIYPIILKIKEKMSWDRLIILSFICAYSFVIIVDPTAKDYALFNIYTNWIVGLPCWLLGCLLAERLDNLKANNKFILIWRWRLAVLITSSICLILRFHSPIGYAYTLNLFAILVTLWLSKEIRYLRAVNYSSVSFLMLEKAGAWSYSLYLIHPLIGYMFGKINFLPNLGYFLNWFILMSFVLGGSYLFYFLVEMPSHNLAKRFKAN